MGNRSEANKGEEITKYIHIHNMTIKFGIIEERNMLFILCLCSRDTAQHLISIRIEFTLSLKLQCSFHNDFSIRSCVLLFNQWVWYSIHLGFNSRFQSWLSHHFEGLVIRLMRRSKEEEVGYDVWLWLVGNDCVCVFQCKFSVNRMIFGICGAFHFFSI